MSPRRKVGGKPTTDLTSSAHVGGNAELFTDGVDCRELPCPDASIDCVVLDPPYME